MTDHPHAHSPHAIAEKPTMSLLRVSAAQRLAGAAVILAAVWAMVLATVG